MKAFRQRRRPGSESWNIPASYRNHNGSHLPGVLLTIWWDNTCKALQILLRTFFNNQQSCIHTVPYSPAPTSTRAPVPSSMALDLVEFLFMLHSRKGGGWEKGNPVVPMKATEEKALLHVFQHGIPIIFLQQHGQFLRSLKPKIWYFISSTSCI